jgi:bifunctional DNA-binding transcriptional regulator/antitoxin component of YhaV-PrlF toxin-antitoxin module
MREKSRQRQHSREAGKPPEESASAEADESSVYARGQTVIPKAIREAAAIAYGTKLRWDVHEGVIRVIPIPQHPARALRGILKGTGMTYEMFMQERQKERQLEQQQEQAWEAKELRRLAKSRRTPGSS